MEGLHVYVTTMKSLFDWFSDSEVTLVLPQIKVLAAGRWFAPGTPVSSTRNKPNPEINEGKIQTCIFTSGISRVVSSIYLASIYICSHIITMYYNVISPNDCLPSSLCSIEYNLTSADSTSGVWGV